jgi:hypothetical protein
MVPMAYVLTLIALLGVFLWATPAHRMIADNFRIATQSIETSVASDSTPFTAYIKNAVFSVRGKAMELLRQELHQSVDSLVK